MMKNVDTTDVSLTFFRAEVLPIFLSQELNHQISPRNFIVYALEIEQLLAAVWPRWSNLEHPKHPDLMSMWWSHHRCRTNRGPHQ